MIDYILDIINAVLYWLEGYLALFTNAVPKNKNFIMKKIFDRGK